MEELENRMDGYGLSLVHPLYAGVYLKTQLNYPFHVSEPIRFSLLSTKIV